LDFPKDGKLPLFGESDERYKVIGGNQQIIYKLAEALGDKIKFQMQVKAITKKGRQYIIDFNQGEPVKADIIICAIPFTILRNIELEDTEHRPNENEIHQRIGLWAE
jgi:monoamine oxidase